MKERPRLIVIAGPNGSGKTSLTEQLRQHTWMEGCSYLNPDEIAQDDFGDWNSPEASIQAAYKAAAIRKEYLIKRKSVAFETVFSAPDKVEFVERAAGEGYFIRLFFICTDGPEINAARIAKRNMAGGHSVPLDKIVSRFFRSIAQGAKIIPSVDRAYVYDNSIENVAPRLLFRSESGRLKKRYFDGVNAWAQPLLDALPK